MQAHLLFLFVFFLKNDVKSATDSGNNNNKTTAVTCIISIKYTHYNQLCMLYIDVMFWFGKLVSWNCIEMYLTFNINKYV